MSTVRIIYNRLLGGWYVVRGPHQAPLSGRFNTKQEAQEWLKRKDYPCDVPPPPRHRSN